MPGFTIYFWVLFFCRLTRFIPMKTPEIRCSKWTYFVARFICRRTKSGERRRAAAVDRQPLHSFRLYYWGSELFNRFCRRTALILKLSFNLKYSSGIFRRVGVQFFRVQRCVTPVRSSPFHVRRTASSWVHPGWLY